MPPHLVRRYNLKGFQMDTVDTAVSAGNLNTFVAAEKAADLVETLKGAGPFTVFAPMDATFAALPAGTVDDLLKLKNKAKITAILTYKVVSGIVVSTDFLHGIIFSTVNFETVTIHTKSCVKS
jgi:uncharacterized surface protein with fasciclin (FAS1) repeats